MSAALEAALSEALGERVQDLSAVAGGDINRAYRARLSSGGQVFVKTHERPPPHFYAREAEGLAFLRDARAVRIPEVKAQTPTLLALEWIESGPRRADFDEQLGRQLAALHRTGAPCFGFVHLNYIGSLPQENDARASWPELYAEQRLRPMARRARDQGTLSRAQVSRVEALCSRLPELCGPSEAPSRVHGDLWSGNVMSDDTGAPVLVDPAVYGGEREMDLAMLELFGSPSARFFAAYADVYPHKLGRSERVALYQVYPLLVHVCLFGAGYVPQLLAALSRYE